MAPLVLQPGETLTFRLGEGVQVTLEIVGVVDRENAGFQNNTVIAPLDALATQATRRGGTFLVDVNPKGSGKAVTALTRSLPEGAFVFETTVILATYRRLFQQGTVLPMLVAALALFSAAIMIANTVALATIERRREIGVMKAVGVKGRQVLGQFLVEGAIIGLVSGVISIGLVMLPLILFSEGLGLPVRINPWPAVRLLALALGVTLAATFISAWPASRRRPLEVLRYE
jgi:ABC-type antimicrobial peptide transport system permease subunit